MSKDGWAGWHIVTPQTRLDNETAGAFAATLAAALAAHARVAVDCAAVDYISSAGLGALLQGARAARAAERQFSVYRPSPRVRQVLEVSRLQDVLNTQDVLPC